MLILQRCRGVLTFAVLTFLASNSNAQPDPSLYRDLPFRELGPWRGGRSVAVSGVPGKKDHFYMGTTGGGLWKSEDAGVTWKPVSDGFFKTGSVGAIAVSASNPDVVYVGMGESEPRGNITYGDGMYKSADGGLTWAHIGLESTQTISRIKVHPTNPSIAYVAALGHVYGRDKNRGVYKTVDGGKTWAKVLYADDRSGAIDLAMDPSNPEVLYASTWSVFRTPYSLESGGPGSRLWKSTNGGATWADISEMPGLPKALRGKIGIGLAPSNPKRIFILLEAKDNTGLYRTDDSGETWKKMPEKRDLSDRPWYFHRVYVDPKDDNKAYVLSVSNYRTTDGGEKWTEFGAMHSDNHDMWIDPADPQRYVIGNDGGATVTINGGKAWTDQDYPTAQIYHVSTDNAWPYRLLGAQQDNSSIRIPSRTFGGGIGTNDWTSTAGGESGYVVAHPLYPEIVFGGNYGGYLERQDHANGLSRNVTPWPELSTGQGIADFRHRFQWTYPIMFSPHDPRQMYTCSQHVLMTRDEGQSWRVISPDLTRNDKSKQGPSGGPISKDNSGVEVYGTVFTLAESPKRKGVLWAGSDDGLIHVSQDAGTTWQNITPKDMPEWSLVSMIEASPHDAGTAYAAVDNHENDDLRPYIYRTKDYGRTWQRIDAGLPVGHYVRVVREDPVVPGMLFAGTEWGLYISFNAGVTWQPFQNNLPITPIHDLTIKNGDLCIATHGRSFWVFDDLSPIRQLAKGVDASKPILFTPPTGFASAGGGGGRRGSGPVGPMAANPLRGLVVTVWLAADAKEAKVEMLDATGAVVATNSLGKDIKKGMRKLSLTPSYPSYTMPKGFRFWGAFPSTIKGAPGKYTVRLTVDGVPQTVQATWEKSPLTTATDADLAEQLRFAKQVAARTNDATQAALRIRTMKEVLAKVDSSEAKALTLRLNQVENVIHQTRAVSSQDDLNYPPLLDNKLAALFGEVNSGYNKPLRAAYEVFNELSGKLQIQLDKLAALQPEYDRIAPKVDPVKS